MRRRRKKASLPPWNKCISRYPANSATAREQIDESKMPAADKAAQSQDISYSSARLALVIAVQSSY